MNKNRTFIVPLIAIAICFSAAFLVSFISLRSVIRDNTRQVTNVIAGRIYDAITNELSAPIAVSRTIARDVYMIDRLKHEDDFDLETNVDDFAMFLGSIRHGFNYETTFLVSEHSRCYYTHLGLNKIIDQEKDPHDIWYTLFTEHRKEFEIFVDEDQTKEDTLTMFINTRVEDEEGNLMGACGMGVQLNNLLELVRQNEERYHVDIDIVDGEGTVLVDSEKRDLKSDGEKKVDLNSHKPNEYIYKMIGDSYVGARYVDDVSWYLVIRNTDEYETYAYKELIVNYFIMLLILLLVLAASLFIVMKHERGLYISSAVDALTGLKSRRAYEDRLKKIQKQDKLVGTYVSIDLNGLKHINDNVGHAAGDELIQGAGHLIRSYFHHIGRCYRIGGDEFAILIDHCVVDPEKIRREFKEIVARWKGQQVSGMSLSIGIARSCDYGVDDIKKLGEFADIEMYKDKETYYSAHPECRR